MTNVELDGESKKFWINFSLGLIEPVEHTNKQVETENTWKTGWNTCRL